MGKLSHASGPGGDPQTSRQVQYGTDYRREDDDQTEIPSEEKTRSYKVGCSLSGQTGTEGCPKRARDSTDKSLLGHSLLRLVCMVKAEERVEKWTGKQQRSKQQAEQSLLMHCLTQAEIITQPVHSWLI